MPYDNAESFNQTLTQVLNGEHADAINQFCQSFIATFNADTQAAKMIGTGKLEMSSSKKEETTQMAATGALDIASLFQVPTGILGKVTEKAISALFKGVRKKGYKKVAGIKAHMTHVELIAEALTLGLTAHYKNELLDEDTLPAPKKWGEKTAKRLLTSLKSKSKKSLELKAQDTLVDHLKALFVWCVKKDYIREEPEPKQKVPQVFSDDDYSTLLLFASAELLGLPCDHFVQAQKTEAKANELLDTIKSMEQEFDNVKQLIEQALQQKQQPQNIINVLEEGATVKGHLSVDINGIMSKIKANLPDNLTKQQNFSAILKQVQEHTSEMADKKSEALSKQHRIINVVPKNTNTTKDSNIKVGIDNVNIEVDLTSSNTPLTPPIPEKTYSTTEHADENTMSTETSLEIPSPGE